LLLQGPRTQIPVLRTEPDLIVLDAAEKIRPSVAAAGKSRLALGILVAAVILAAIKAPLIGEIMLGAALLTVIVGVLSMDQAYGAIEWRSVFLVAGMLPLGLAMTKSGAAAAVANSLVHALQPFGPLALLAGLFLLATLLTQAMHGAVVATVVAPVAIQAAQQAGLDPRSLAMGVALATSMAFLTPLGHPVNVLVMGPGGYRFRDYRRVGLPLTALLFAIVMIVLPIFWPLVPQ
jgi:di/tricarboxylate transporter